jgi:hypothetical protein
MHDSDDIRERDDCAALADALHALPQATPPRDALPQLKAAFRTARPPAAGSRRPLHWPYAAAAGLVALAATVLWLQRPPQMVDVPPPVVASTAEPAPQTTTPSSALLAQLVAQNQVYEAALRSPGLAGAPANAGMVLADAELGDLIGMVDVELSATADTAEQVDLWARRLVLLRELTALRAGGVQPDATLADAAHYRTAAWPMN